MGLFNIKKMKNLLRSRSKKSKEKKDKEKKEKALSDEIYPLY